MAAKALGAEKAIIKIDTAKMGLLVNNAGRQALPYRLTVYGEPLRME